MAAAAVAALGALLVGEYDLTGWRAPAAGLLFGVAVAEAALVVARRPQRWLGAACALLAAGGLYWAAWIASARGRFAYPTTAWVAMALGAATAALWARPQRPRHDQSVAQRP